MTLDDGSHGFEDAWADLRPRMLFEPPKNAVPGRAWLGVGLDTCECGYPSYKRVGVALFLDGTDMVAHFKAMESEFDVNWAGLWFKSLGGEPFYQKALRHTHVQPGDSLNVNLSIIDESGLVTSVFRSLNLL